MPTDSNKFAALAPFVLVIFGWLHRRNQWQFNARVIEIVAMPPGVNSRSLIRQQYKKLGMVDNKFPPILKRELERLKWLFLQESFDAVGVHIIRREYN